jgi:LuxR family maltose regulon positive regulatory protein
MTALGLPDAHLDWARCLSVGAHEAEGILAQSASRWQSDPVELLRLASAQLDATPSNPYAALAYLGAARELLVVGTWHTSVAGVLRARVERARGNGPQSLAELEHAEAALDECDLGLGDRMRLIGVIRIERGLTALVDGDLPTCLRELEHGRALLDEDTLPGLHAEVHGSLAIVAFLVGRLDRCREELDRARRRRLSGRGELATSVATALEAVEVGRAAAVISDLVAHRAMAEGTAYAPLLVAAESICHEALGNTDAVERALWRLEDFSVTTARLARNLGLAVWLSLLAARREIAPALGALRSITPDPSHALCPAAWEGRLLLETGDYARAIAVTAECLQLGSTHAARTQAYVLAVNAAAHSGLRDTVTADAFFARTLSLAALTGLRRYLVTLPADHLMGLLSRAAAAGLPAASAEVVADITRMLPPPPPPQALLSVRERIVLQHLAEGESQHRIAWLLSVSHNTVKSQVRSVYRKLDVDSREAAVERGRVLGFVE